MNLHAAWGFQLWRINSCNRHLCDRKWTRVTKCTHSRVVGLRLGGNIVGSDNVHGWASKETENNEQSVCSSVLEVLINRRRMRLQMRACLRDASERRRWPSKLGCPSAPSATARPVDILQTRGPPRAPAAVSRQISQAPVYTCLQSSPSNAQLHNNRRRRRLVSRFLEADLFCHNDASSFLFVSLPRAVNM